MIEGSDDFIEEWEVKFFVKVENALHFLWRWMEVG
jgi:hypothetical protein